MAEPIARSGPNAVENRSRGVLKDTAILAKLEGGGSARIGESALGGAYVYAIVETGGKQFRVAEGDVLRVEKLEAEPGATVELERVLALAKDDGQLVVGTPVVPGAKAVAKVLEHGKGPKLLVFKYKSKANYRRKKGHRQPFTKLQIEKIEG